MVACIWFEKTAPTAQLAEFFFQWSPQICLRQDQAIFIEIGKCRKLYSESRFKALALAFLRQRGYSALIGVAPDLLQALVLTLYKKKNFDEVPLQALLEVADPFCRDEILRKSVQSLVLSFEDLGLKTLGQFKQLKVEELIARFGVVGRFCHLRAVETNNFIWPYWKPEDVIEQKKQFPYFEFYGELEPLLFELKTHMDSIFLQLFARQKKLSKLRVQIKCEKTSARPHNERVFDFNFFIPQTESKSTLKILKERLARAFESHPLHAPLQSITTTVVQAVPSNFGQKNLLDHSEERQERIHSIHNQLIELLGGENVFQATLTQDRRPEKSWQKSDRPPHVPQVLTFDLENLIPQRSTYLCRHPLRVEVTAGFVHIKKRRYRILSWFHEVEKISGGWFEDPTAEVQNSYDRNYYNVELEGHQRVWIFETINREYYLHGYYG